MASGAQGATANLLAVFFPCHTLAAHVLIGAFDWFNPQGNRQEASLLGKPAVAPALAAGEVVIG